MGWLSPRWTKRESARALLPTLSLSCHPVSFKHQRSLWALLLVSTLGLCLLLPAGVFGQDVPILSRRAIFHPVFAASGMVATQEATATRVGVEILARGGNAVDAAVAIGFTLAVTLPKAGNLGGGGFMVLYNARAKKTTAIDYREKAPAAASRDMFLGPAGEVDKARARFSHLSVGVPGTVAGLVLALERYGTLSLPEVVAPAIRLAEQGIVVTHGLARDLKRRRKLLARWPATRKVFFKPGGVPYEVGDRLVQRDLGNTLRQIAEGGVPAFYTGRIAGNIAAEMQQGGGLITLADMANYQALERSPVKGSYRGFEIMSMPPPSSGGVHLIQLLNVLEGFPIKSMGLNSAATIHVMAEAMKFAFADRSRFLGDPDYGSVPVAGLTSKGYADSLRRRIVPGKATLELAAGDPRAYESTDTTHFSVMDGKGNVVANTYTLNFSFGTGIVAAGTGVLLNNEMDDFAAKPGSPNAFGLTGGAANAVQPGKRPLSSMAPTIVFRHGEPLLATGSPGGSRIITTVLQLIMNVIDHDLNVAEATNASRVHHQWLPDVLRVETGLSPDTLRLLRQWGQKVVVKNAMGSTQSIMRIPRGFLGASDPRRPGGLALGY